MPLIFEVKVVPSSGRSAWVLDKSDNLKCYLKSPAEHGKANEELIKAVAKALGVPQAMVSIVQGYQSRKKLIKINADIAYEALLHKLGIERQIKIF